MEEFDSSPASLTLRFFELPPLEPLAPSLTIELSGANPPPSLTQNNSNKVCCRDMRMTRGSIDKQFQYMTQLANCIATNTVILEWSYMQKQKKFLMQYK